jgi:hypothetical protein
MSAEAVERWIDNAQRRDELRIFGLGMFTKH